MEGEYKIFYILGCMYGRSHQVIASIIPGFKTMVIQQVMDTIRFDPEENVEWPYSFFANSQATAEHKIEMGWLWL